jgi:predicted nucleic acid-binding protein
VAVTYLADTSVLTRMAVPPVRAAVRELAHHRAVARCAMTDLELGFSARNATEWDRIRHAAAAFATEDIALEDFRRAKHVKRMLAAAGLKGRKVPDLLIAAIAERTQRSLLHYDRDFELVAEQTGQRQRWVVLAGSVD